MSDESDVIDHYGGTDLLQAIAAGLAELGLDPGTATVDLLAPVDEFHVGGRPAATELCARIEIDASHRVLDVGCGIGGTARFIASTFGADVTGIDLTPAYTAVGEELNRWTGLEERVHLTNGSALDMPFPDGHFDRAVQLHVGMNIEDKASLFSEIARVLAPGGRFGLYDIMATDDVGPEFPVPWAGDSSTSFLAAPADYREHLADAGFVITAERDRAGFAVEFFTQIAARRAQAGGPAPLGLHLIMGSEAPTKIANMVAAVGGGHIAPVEMICEKSAN
ncbi:MAG: methyltransferase domain-containing protein [Acidimicrobiales bacterium]